MARQVRPLRWIPALAPAPALGVTLGKLLDQAQGLRSHLAKVAIMTGFAELTHVTALCEPGDRRYVNTGLFHSLRPQVWSSVFSFLSLSVCLPWLRFWFLKSCGLRVFLIRSHCL